MKKMVLAMMAALMMSANVMAQDGQTEASRPERRQMNQAEMIQHRTDRMVKTYGLNEEQAVKLKELNTQFAGKMGRPQGGRGMKRGGGPGPRAKEGNDSLKHKGPARPDMQEMRNNMEAYDAELQKILTPEQYQNYKKDMEKRMNQGNRHPRGQRPHKDN